MTAEQPEYKDGFAKTYLKKLVDTFYHYFYGILIDEILLRSGKHLGVNTISKESTYLGKRKHCSLIFFLASNVTNMNR